MSIVIKSNELNTLIYKYLLQAGLTHTSYTLFNQAKLQSSLQEFKYDIKSGHLLMLLEKGLILSQIQSHVNFGDYQECLQPFYLLKSHTCKITQKIRTQQDNFMKQLNNNITQCIKRTNAVYNTELTNKNYQEIVYQPRGVNYFEKFEKFRINQGELGYGQGEGVKIDGEKESVMAVWNRAENVVYLAQNDGYEDTIVSKVYPCTLNGQMEPLQLLKLTPSSLIMVFAQNRVKLINRQTDQPLQFTIPLKDSITSIQPNPNIFSLITFQSKSQYFVMNLKNMEEIVRGQGIMKWRGFDECVVLEAGQLQLRSLLKEQALIAYLPLEVDQQKFIYQVDEIEISPNKTFFYVVSYNRNKIWVYTFEKEECLYVFDFSGDEQQIRKVIWSHRNQVDYLCILTDIAIRVWEVELNSYCLKIDLQKYDMGEVHSIVSLEKSQTETFLLALGTENLLVSDIANQKIERVESPIDANNIQNVGKSSVFVSTEKSVYFIDGQRLSELFK